jgi:ATP-dependent Clp protease ATP-binding subunit ClpA
MVRFDMSDSRARTAIMRLLGGSDGKIYGALTEAVSEKPTVWCFWMI